MRKSVVKIALNGEEFSLEDAAILLDYDKMKLNNLVNRAPNGFKLREKDNIVIKRIDTPRVKRGVEIVRASDGKKWNSIKLLAAELNVNKATVAATIRKTQHFEYNGEQYDAINYVPRKIVFTKPKGKRIEIEPLTEQPVLNVIPRQHIEKEIKEAVQRLDIEQQVFDLLKKLAIERIQKTEYDKASKVLSALEMLTK